MLLKNQLKHATISLPEKTACPICERSFARQGFLCHLRSCSTKHGMTMTDYENAHPMHLYGPVHQFAAKWFSLAKFSIWQFGLMDYAGLAWCHINSNAPKDWYYRCMGARKHRLDETKPLLVKGENRSIDLHKSFFHFRKHLAGELTLGIWPDLDNSFTVIDLDGDQTDGLSDLCERLIDLRLHYYIEFSGKKGFHIWIYWDRVLPHDQLIQMHEYLGQDLEFDRKLWPFKQGLIKLPLGLHRATNNLACFLDDHLQPLPLDQQLDYFLAIRTNMPPELPGLSRTVRVKTEVDICTQTSRIKINERESDSRRPEWSLSTDEYRCTLDDPFVPSDLSREILLGPLAAFLKDVDGLSKEACVQELTDWSHAVSCRTVRELDYDVKRQVDWIYRTGVLVSSGKLVQLTKEQKKLIGSYIYDLLCTPRAISTCSRPLDKGQRDMATATLTAIAEYVTRLILTNDGSCHVSFSTIAKRTGINPKRVQKWLPRLCGEPWIVAPRDWRFWNFDQEYEGKMFVRAAAARYASKRAQAYKLSEPFARQLGVESLQKEEACSLVPGNSG